MTETPGMGFRYSDGSAPQDRPQEAAQAPPEGSENPESEFSHYVHLADGRVLKKLITVPLDHLGFHMTENENDPATGGNKIIGIYPK